VLWSATINHQPLNEGHEPHHDPPAYAGIGGLTIHGEATISLHQGHDQNQVGGREGRREG
jgi:hypothetical protein